MKLLVIYFAAALGFLQEGAGEPVVEGKDAGRMAGFGKDNQRDVIGREKYPFMAYLEITDKTKNVFHFCGGTIIRGRVVLTAAHCFASTSGNLKVYAVAGILHLKVERDRAQVRKMYDYLIHENYVHYEMKKNSQGVSEILEFRNDIALVWLVNHFEYNAKVNQIPLMTPNTKLLHKTGFILGWGQTEKGVCSTMLKITDLRVVPKSECELTKKGEHYVIDQGMLCTKSDNELSQQCGGDSGGPFVVDNKLAGVISNSYKVEFTLPNGKDVLMTTAKYGAVVTNVAFYTKWILHNIEQGPPKDRNRQKKPQDHSKSRMKNRNK